MYRPSRPELVTKFFPELKQNIGATTGDKEAIVGINTRATEAVLQDFIGLYDTAAAVLGEGVLAVRLSKDNKKESNFVTLEELQLDADDAVKVGDDHIASSLGDIISIVSGMNTEQAVPLLLIDSRLTLCLLKRDNPAAAITAMMEEMVG
tara:strand:- start:3948 stop:4397 length:450 start_codon:yes stop_codon:yes gene_type:complete